MSAPKTGTTVLNPGTRYCPACGSDWRASEIPAQYRKYYGGATHYSRLIGLETPGYDGVSFWCCPDCGETWDRWRESPPTPPEHTREVACPCCPAGREHHITQVEVAPAKWRPIMCGYCEAEEAAQRDAARREAPKEAA